MSKIAQYNKIHQILRKLFIPVLASLSAILSIFLVIQIFPSFFLFTNKDSFPLTTPSTATIRWAPPEPSLYPTAQNIRSIVSSEWRRKDTSFETADFPEMVIEYYERSLIDLGYNKIEKPGIPAHHIYLSGPDGPAYGFHLRLFEQDGRTQVQTSMTISGPFSVFFPTTTPIP